MMLACASCLTAIHLADKKSSAGNNWYHSACLKCSASGCGTKLDAANAKRGPDGQLACKKHAAAPNSPRSTPRPVQTRTPPPRSTHSATPALEASPSQTPLAAPPAQVPHPASPCPPALRQGAAPAEDEAGPPPPPPQDEAGPPPPQETPAATTGAADPEGAESHVRRGHVSQLVDFTPLGDGFALTTVFEPPSPDVAGAEGLWRKVRQSGAVAQVASMCGDTNAGKSTVIHALLDRNGTSGPRPLVGTGRCTTSGIRSYETEFPGRNGALAVRLLDNEGENASVPPEEVGDVEWTEAQKEARRDCVHLKGPLLAYAISNVIIYIASFASVNHAWIDKVLSFVVRQNRNILSQRPSLILIQNQCPPREFRRSTVADTTQRFLDDNDPGHHLERYYEHIRFMQIPQFDEDMTLFYQGIDRLRDTIAELLESRRTVWCSDAIWLELFTRVVNRLNDPSCPVVNMGRELAQIVVPPENEHKKYVSKATALLEATVLPLEDDMSMVDDGLRLAVASYACDVASETLHRKNELSTDGSAGDLDTSESYRDEMQELVTPSATYLVKQALQGERCSTMLWVGGRSMRCQMTRAAHDRHGVLHDKDVDEPEPTKGFMSNVVRGLTSICRGITKLSERALRKVGCGTPTTIPGEFVSAHAPNIDCYAKEKVLPTLRLVIDKPFSDEADLAAARFEVASCAFRHIKEAGGAVPKEWLGCVLCAGNGDLLLDLACHHTICNSCDAGLKAAIAKNYGNAMLPVTFGLDGGDTVDCPANRCPACGHPLIVRGRV